VLVGAGFVDRLRKLRARRAGWPVWGGFRPLFRALASTS